MPTEAENPKPTTPRRSKRDGVLRRLWRWWGGLWFSKLIHRLGEWLYDWWFPFSETPQGYHGYHSNHGYSGASRQNRVKWLWRRSRRLVRRSFAGKAVRSISDRWYDWWYPVADEVHAYSSHGRVRRHRLVRDWRRLKRLVSRSFFGRGSEALVDRLAAWWYPPPEEAHPYPAYTHRRRNRLAQAWIKTRRRIHSSWIVRKYRLLVDDFYEWYFPVVEGSGAGYSKHRRVSRPVRFIRRRIRWFEQTWLGSMVARIGHKYRSLRGNFYEWYFPVAEGSGGGYSRHRRVSRPVQFARRRIRWFGQTWLGQKLAWIVRKYRLLAYDFYEWYFPVAEGSGGGYSRHRRVSRPVQFARQCNRRFRRTWLGLKLGWLLDELETVALAVQTRAAHDFAWRRIQTWLWRWQTLVMLVCLGTAIGFAYNYGLPRYLRYIEQKYAQQAQQFLAKGDVSRAMLRARQVLNQNSDNVDAIRVFAELADYFDPPHAIHWRQRLVALNPNPTNRLALAKTAMRGEAFPFPTATKALNEIEPAFRQTSTYHLVAGSLAIKLSDLKAAEQHYAEALKLDPDDPVNRMSLAVVRLQSRDPKFIADSRTTLELLRTDRHLGLLATRSLVAESIARREFTKAEALSQQILTNAQASFSDRIVHLAILNAEKSAHLNLFLTETQKRAEEHPFYIAELASWMTRFGFAQTALDWLNGLPPQLAKQGLLPIVVADTYVALGQWKALAEFLQKERWVELDAVRIGMMSFAFWKEFGDKRSSTVWQQAIRLAARSPTTLKTLAEMAAGWGWKDETEDVLWYAAGKYPAEGWPLSALQNLYTGQRDTAGLRRVFRAMIKKDPKDALARNNFAMVSLLLRADMADALQSAADLHSADPKNPVFTSTYAFSIYLQGRAKEAAQALRDLGLDQLDDPSLAAYYAIFLSAAGDTQTARTYFVKSAKAFLLPEELALVERAKKAM